MTNIHLSTAGFAVALIAAGSLTAVQSFAHEMEMHKGAAHEQHESFSAGMPGDPKKASRTVEITMEETSGAMLFTPSKVTVRKGEQIRFVLRNIGKKDHEFVLATTKENLKHAEEMKRFPDMEHDDPNGKRVKAGETSEIVWRFTRAGEFEFSCNIPGHREAGMTGNVIVK
jgi:uncharacterized cupredoxin-like copper-binding protein